jgi:hypothetical protein
MGYKELFTEEEILDIEEKLDQIYNLACPASPPHYQKDPLFTINTCYMYRSIDINESQVVGSVGFGVTISQVKAYLDGCEVYFEGESAPLKLWWHGDQSDNFDGVNVNNERLVSFTKVNSILTD